MGWAVALLAQTTSDPTAPEPDTTAIAGLLAAVLVVGAALSAWVLWRRDRRAAALPKVAAAAGLQYSAEDRFDGASGNFELFRDGDGRQVEHVMWRDGGRARAFDYAYYREHRDDAGRVRRTWTHFTCATARHGGRWPDISILQERLVDRALRTVGLPDVELESDEFNRRFVVQCRDKKFATDLLDPQMMELLLAAPAGINIEVRGPKVLAWSRPAPPEALPAMVALVEGFVSHVPPVVVDLYDTHGPDVPDLADLGLRPADPETWRDPVWNGFSGAGGPHVSSTSSTPRPWLGTWDADDDRRRRDSRAAEAPGQEFDLDGNSLAPPEEDPWGDGLPPRRAP